MLQLDHFAVAGATLEEAAAHVETTLGVPLQAGGQHALFGTHNRLLGLADGLYLEAIAVDPGAPAPTRPRWFDLDRFTGAPRICNWICRTQDITATLAALPVKAGTPVAVHRGDLKWQMAVTQTGNLPFDNLFPAVMSWQSPHPAPRLTPQGCRLRRLLIAHPEASTLANLVPLNDSRVVYEPGQAAICAEIETPHGLRVLR